MVNQSVSSGPALTHRRSQHARACRYVLLYAAHDRLIALLYAGAYDVDSPKGPIAPWLRSLDALNTHDEAAEYAMAGGVTTVQVVPGNTNPIGKGHPTIAHIIPDLMFPLQVAKHS